MLALTSGQKKLFDSGVNYYDLEACSPGLGSNSSAGDASSFPIRTPYIADPERLAQVIDEYIKSVQPSSPLNGLGRYFVQGGMRAGINPLLAVSQAQTESSFATAGVATNASNNAFGRQATESQPHVTTNALWYKWDSWEKSLLSDAYPASGKAEQPDDWFQYVARRYANELDDINAFIPKYAPEFENDTAGYISSVLSIATKLATTAGKDVIDLSKFGSVSVGGGGSETPLTVGGGGTVVALDPGHGGVVEQYTDTVTGLGDRETANSPEREDMLDVANIIKTQLEQAGGYRVVLLRTGADEAVSKRQRVDQAKQEKASIAVSLHSDTSPIEEVWPQFVGGYRQTGETRVTFSNNETANLSSSYSDIMVRERNAAQFGGNQTVKKVVGQADSFGPDRGLPAYGDISLVQLWSDSVPWVYNETTAPAGGMSSEQKQTYATGIANGIKRAVAGSAGSATNNCGAAKGNGNVVQTALSYAWPDYRSGGSDNARELKPEYATAVATAQANGRYVGGIRYPGVDCGGFVTTVMVDSGFEPLYNHSSIVASGAGYTAVQLAWVRENWQLVGRGNEITTESLQPGDVAFKVNSDGSNDGHTFMWVGSQSGFQYPVASASMDERAGMAGAEDPLENNIEWYRKL